MCDKCAGNRELCEQISERMNTAERVREYYRRQGEERERERIINLLLDQNIIRRDVTGKLVAFNTHGTEVVYIKNLEEK